MQRVSIMLAGHEYHLACDDGQEDHLTQLAAEMDARARDVAAALPSAGEVMRLVITLMKVADELYESRQEAGMLHEKVAYLRSRLLQEGHAGTQGELTGFEAQEVLTSTMDELAVKFENMTKTLKQNQ